ncbi:Gfo/Idh/MocA family protein [Alkalihalobacillus sp. CinArs1]|uniref:Gfo/Idh/MocA family protein n=1 Tax=Alkalihalobacillus sp. CinArs1 TaxID=2995314 RepID=UPI0022DE3F0A|nr:Gfo/Idh/MocA family oxidoreductase [Alkalihalobacillus sp. CinArs1]
MNLAMLSFWHVHAKDYAKEALDHPETLITAVWDEYEERGRSEAQKWGAEYIDSIDDLLRRDTIDGVVVTSPTNMHKDLIIKAAKAGKHIFTEKVLAATEEEALEIIETVKQEGVKLFVSLPRVYDGYTKAIQDILASGEIGDITQSRVRLAHDGAIADWLPHHFYDVETCQGGALIDLGCHPVYLTRLFQGMPQRISAQFGYMTGKEVEDQAVVTFQYGSGSYGIIETGFVNPHSPFTIELHGTKGSVLYRADEGHLLLNTGNGFEKVSIPADRPSPFNQWVEHVKHNKRTDENIALALDLTVLMEASYRSVQQESEVAIIS